MTYDTNEDPYVDKTTGVLKNKIGAKTQAALDKVEAEITYVIIATLTVGSSVDKLKFDSALLRDIHKEIFGDIYEWAGRLRTHDISKEWAYFAHAQYIENELSRLDGEIDVESTASYADKDFFVDRLTYFYGEFNAIHPFREGNGRTLRTFLRLYALRYGYDINWSMMTTEENNEASKASMARDLSLLRQMLSRLVTLLE